MPAALHLLKHDSNTSDSVIQRFKLDTTDRPDRIRCPHCGWVPAPSSRWACHADGTPEPHFDACGTVWNTFSTRGRCPGCQHQWQWTSCLQCGTWAPHEDWYESES